MISKRLPLSPEVMAKPTTELLEKVVTKCLWCTFVKFLPKDLKKLNCIEVAYCTEATYIYIYICAYSISMHVNVNTQF